MRGQQPIYAFNRGITSPRGLARVDLKRLAFSAEEQTNWMPRSLGSMMLRPGTQFIANTPGSAPTVSIPFVFGAGDSAQIEMSASGMRVLVNDALIMRSATGAAVGNGTFTTDLAGWTDLDEAGATSDWFPGGYMALTGNGAAYAWRQRSVAISAIGTPHAFRIVIQRGPVLLRIGETSAGTELARDVVLRRGTHSIVVTPSVATVYLQFRSPLRRRVLVDSVSVEGAGPLFLPTPYVLSDLPNLRWQQSGDVVFVACAGKQQMRIERRVDDSWSIVYYQPDDGPFRVQNTTPTTMSVSVLAGNGSMTSSTEYFYPEHVGALFTLTPPGQRVDTSFTTANTFGDSVVITTVGEARRYTLTVSGTWVGKVTLQRSIGDDNSWEDHLSWTTNATWTEDDDLDNQIVYYRVGVKAGDYTSGTMVTVLDYPYGAITGVVRVTSFASNTNVNVELLKPVGSTKPTDVWAEGEWSEHRGWPSSVVLHDSRLFWAGNDKFLGSLPDGYDSFDQEQEGDSAYISRTIGFGPVERVQWIMSMARLLAGTPSMEISCRSSSLDEPLTAANFRPKKIGTQGSASVAAVDVDSKCVFLQRSARRLYEMAYSIEANDYETTTDLTMLCPDLLAPGVIRMVVQRQPDTRIHCVRSDGKVAILLYDKAENIQCWVLYETTGIVEDAFVLPGTSEDAVYYTVRRVIDGSPVRMHERWALESECIGGQMSKLADCHVVSTTPASTISAPHLTNASVVVWADGKSLGTMTVPGSGILNLGATYSQVCVGLPYEARFKSSKLAYMVEQGGSAIGARKRVNTIALALLNTHRDGIEYGMDFDLMDTLPLVEEYVEVEEDHIHIVAEMQPIEVPGTWTTDARMCLRAQAPLPCTVAAAVIDMTSNTK